MNAVACPDAAALARLCSGQLSAAEVEVVSAHLEGCDRCARAVAALPEDTLAALARNAHRLPALDVEAGSLNPLIGKVLRLRPGASTMNSAALDTGASAPPAAAVAVSAGMSFGRYRIVRELGRGGMGTVYEAVDSQLQRRVALKVPQFAGSPQRQEQMRGRFLREARASARVDHANVCKIYDVGEQDGRPFVVMALIDGTSLDDRLPEGRRVKERDAVALTLKVAAGLLAVHAHGIIHRDLKPANILMTRDNQPILTDFGLAHDRADANQLTGEGALLGTPAYMAPEQAVPRLGPVTERADLYSLGVVLFRMLTGRLPAEGGLPQIFGHHYQGNAAPPASRFNPRIDPALDAIVARALAHRPEDRYPDVPAFAEALKGWLRAPQASPPPGGFQEAAREEPTVDVPAAQQLSTTVEVPPPQQSEPRRRQGWRWIGVGLTLLACVAVGAVIVCKHLSKDDRSGEAPEKVGADAAGKSHEPKETGTKDGQDGPRPEDPKVLPENSKVTVDPATAGYVNRDGLDVHPAWKVIPAGTPATIVAVYEAKMYLLQFEDGTQAWVRQDCTKPCK